MLAGVMWIEQGGEMPSPKSLLTINVSEAKSTQRVLIHNRVVCIILLSIRNPRYLTPTNSLRYKLPGITAAGGYSSNPTIFKTFQCRPHVLVSHAVTCVEDGPSETDSKAKANCNLFGFVFCYYKPILLSFIRFYK